MTTLTSGILGAIWKGLKSFGNFWKNFLIGDAPEIALGVVIILIIAYFLHSFSLAVQIVLPATVLVLLTVSVWLRTR